jgi:hypothetical protein
MRFEIDPDIVPNLKLGLHSFQIILSLVAWCLQIGVFNAKDAEVNGRNGWTFAVVCQHFYGYLTMCMVS